MEVHKRQAQGFTLIEIMIVVAIVAVLAAFAVPNFFAYVHTSRVNLCVSNLQMLDNATESYRIINNLAPNFEVTLSMLAPEDGASVDDASKYVIRRMPKCPAGGTYLYDTEAQRWKCSLGDGENR